MEVRYSKKWALVFIAFFFLTIHWSILSTLLGCPPPETDPSGPPCNSGCCNSGGIGGGGSSGPRGGFPGEYGNHGEGRVGPASNVSAGFLPGETGGGGSSSPGGTGCCPANSGSGKGSGSGGVPDGAASFADPVYARTGEFQYSVRDAYIPGPIPVEIVRNYGSQRNYDTPFGYNWTLNYNMKIKVVNSTTLSLINSKACLTQYTKVSSNPDTYAYLGDSSNYIVAVSSPYNEYQLIFKKTGIVYHFCIQPEFPFMNGKLIRITDKYNNEVSIGLDPATGHILSISSAGRTVLWFGYWVFSPNRMAWIEDFTGRVWSYFYRDNGDLWFVWGPSANNPDPGNSGERTTAAYDYDDNHRLTHIYNVLGPENEELVLQNYYDANGKVYRQDYADGSTDASYDTTNSVVTVYDGEEHGKTITYNSAGQKVEETVYTDDSQANPNHFTTQYVYNEELRLQRIIYPAGNCVEYTYNDNGFQEGIFRKTAPSVPNTSSSENVIATLYTYCSGDPALYSNAESVTDALGNETEYEYYSNGYLKKITYPEISTPSGLRRATVQYTYTDIGKVDTVTDPNGIVTQYVYYSTPLYKKGLVWKIIQDYGLESCNLNLTTIYEYDSLCRVTSITDPDNKTTQYAYNYLDQMSQVTSAAPFNYVTKYTYDKSGKINKIERQTSDSQNPWQTTEMTYNAWGKVIQTKDALNHTTTYNYDGNERKIYVEDALNRHTHYFYDERGLLVKVTDPNNDDTIYTYDVNGNRLSVTDTDDRTTTYDYDDFGRMVKVTDAEGHYRIKTLDKLSRLTKEIAYDRKVLSNPSDDVALLQTRFEYDAAGDLIRRAVMADADSAAAVVTNVDRVTDYAYYWGSGPLAKETKYYANGSSAVSWWYYTRLNDIRNVVDPNQNVTTYTYSNTRRVTRIQKLDRDPIGSNNLLQTTDFVYDSLGRQTVRIEKPQNPDAQSDSSWQRIEYSYDALSNRTQETKPNGVITKYEYDLLGRKTKMIADYGGINQVTEYGYDDIGRQTTIAGFADDSNSAIKQTTAYEYDNMSRITKITYPDNVTIRYAYIAAGKVWKRTDQRGVETCYTYDKVYNMTQKLVSISGTVTTENFTYDGLGRMGSGQKLEGANQVSLSEFAYNDKGKISDAWETVLDSDEHHIQYAYDNAGNRTRTTYPGASAIDRTNTWDGRIGTLSQAGTTLADYKYIGGRTARRSYPQPQVTTDTAYDNLGRVVSIDAGASRAKFEYSYVVNGNNANENNIYRMQFDHRTGSPYNEFTYDNLDRVTNVTYLSNQNDAEAFPMDDLGNRTGNVTQRDDVHTYTSAIPNITNRYTAIDSVSITHDAAGNLTQDKNGYHYVYDYENRVTGIYKMNGQTQVPVADYTYDALGRRIEVQTYYEGLTDLRYRYWYNDSWQYLTQELTWPGNASIYRNFVYGNYIDEALCFQWDVNGQPGQRNYFLHDHLYSPTAMVGSDGSVAERYEYDVYGKRTVKTNNFQDRAYSLFGNDFGLSGREVGELDFNSSDAPRLQHMHYRHRDYNPFMGQFMQQDPQGIAPIFTNLRHIAAFNQYRDGMNLYEYVKSKPIIRLDPEGKALWYCTTDSDFGIGKHGYIYNDSYGDNLNDVWPGMGDGKGGQSCGMNGSTGSRVGGNPCNSPFPDGCKKGPKQSENSPWKGDNGDGQGECQRIGGTDDPDSSLCVMSACYNNINSWPLWFPWIHDCHNGVQDSFKKCGVDMVDDNGKDIPVGRL